MHLNVPAINRQQICSFQASSPLRNFRCLLFMCKRIVYLRQLFVMQPGASKGSWVTNWPLTQSQERQETPEKIAWNCASMMTIAGRSNPLNVSIFTHLVLTESLTLISSYLNGYIMLDF